MKKQLIASLILSTLSGAAFALPGDEQPPLTERHQYSAPATVAEGGAERLADDRTVAESGSDRLLDSRTIAEDGSERTKAFRVAEGGAERLINGGTVAENGSERVARQSA